MKKGNNIVAIVIIALALAIVFIVVGGVPWGERASAPTRNIAVNTPGNSPATGAASTTSPAARTFTPHPPHGSVTYQIAQAATQLPGFSQATIDPVDVSVGQIQHFVIVTDDPNPVTSVVAVITTDHKTITVPLVSQGVPAVSMLVPHTIYVTSGNQLAFVTPSGSGASNIAETQNGAHVANAADSNDTEFTGQWTVEDTHTAKYSTTFIAQDAAGNENSVTLQWTDPCPFVTTDNYSGATLTISAPCTMDGGVGISSVDGVENGNLLVTSGTLQIYAGNTLILNTGYDISFSGSGAIALPQPPTTASIVIGDEMCGTDNDGDRYTAGSWSITTSTCSGGQTLRRDETGIGGGDCDDNDIIAHPGQYYDNGGFLGTSPEAGPTSTEQALDSAWPWDFNCDGTTTVEPFQAYPVDPGSVVCPNDPPTCGPGSYSDTGVVVPTSTCGQTFSVEESDACEDSGGTCIPVTTNVTFGCF